MSQRSRAWCFTCNNYNEDDISRLQIDYEYLIYGKEVGESGTKHLQGYIHFKNAKTFKSLQKKLGSSFHIEKRRGTFQQAIDYCKKEGDFVEFGNKPLTPVEAGKKGVEKRKAKNLAVIDGDLEELVRAGEISINEVPVLKKAKLILQQEGNAIQTDGVRGEWYWGPPGVGKTHKARTENPGAYIKDQNKWWCGYAGEKVVILDDFDTSCLGHYLKIWADKWKCYGEVKGGKVALKHEKFIVTSNYLPEHLWSEDEQMRDAIKRRFKVTHFTNLK